MWKSTALLLLLTGCLTSCATGSRQYPADLRGRLSAYAGGGVCCDDPSGFEYVQLPEAGSVDLVIGRESPAFEFQSGLSRFAAFRLPAGSGPFRVRVKSFFDGAGPAGGSVFYPVLAMMDESFIVTRVSNLENLRLEQSLATPGGESGLAVTAPFDPSISPERYLVVFTPAVLLGAAPSERREGDVLTNATLDWLQRRDIARVAASPFGRISILIAPIEPPGPG